jgi:hypothetical protein
MAHRRPPSSSGTSRTFETKFDRAEANAPLETNQQHTREGSAMTITGGEQSKVTKLGSHHYGRAGLLNLFPGFGLGYRALHRRTAFRTSVGSWLVMTAIGIVSGFLNPGASAFSLQEALTVGVIAALMAWALVAVISADHLLIASIMQGWRTKGAWSRLAAIMRMSVVLMGSFIYFVAAALAAAIVGALGFGGFM